MLNSTQHTTPMRLRTASLLAALLLTAPAASFAQVSFSTAIDLALKTSPRVKMAQADLARAIASHREARDVYVPVVSGNSGGLGYSHGFPLGIPTEYTFTAQSLVYSFAQGHYIRSTADGVSASAMSLKDVREQVVEDTANTYIALNLAQQKRKALAQEAEAAQHLQAIVKDRLDAGEDNAMELTRARRTAAQVRLALLYLDDEIESDADRLARLIGIPPGQLATVPESVPTIPSADLSGSIPDTPAIQAEQLSARAKREQAKGDAKYTLYPQFSFGADYSKLSTYNNAYVQYYPSVVQTANGMHLSDSGVGFSLNVTIPFLDLAHRDRAHQVKADADHFEASAQLDRGEVIAGRLKLKHATAELAAKADLASIDKDLAQQQLDIILLQLQVPPTGAGPITTPKEEQNARIQERQRFIDMLDAQSQLDQAKVSLLRQAGQLESWLKTTVGSNALTLK